MKKIVFWVFLFGNIAGVSAQKFMYPAIKQTRKTKADFVPKDWKILKEAKGDLNKDGLADWAMVIQYQDSVEEQHTKEDYTNSNPRILVIIFQNSDKKGFTKKLQSNHFILREDEGGMSGDTFHSMEVTNSGILEIFFEFLGGHITYKFRYQTDNFYLIGAEDFEWDRGSLDFTSRSYNFLTMKVKCSEGNLSDEKPKDKVYWKKLEIKELKTFDTFIRPFTWEIEKDTYL